MASGLVAELAVRAREQGTVEGVPFVRTLAGSSRTLDIMLSWGDGQAFYAIARDPTLSHPEAFVRGAAELAYRAQRPLVPYLAYTLALGRPGAVGWVFVGLVIAGAGVAAGAAAWLGGRPWVGAAVVLTPGALASLNGLEVDVFAFGIAALGAGAWRARRSLPLALPMFTAAVLCRETTIIVPVGLIAFEWTFERRTARTALLAAVPAAAFAAWAAAVQAIVGVPLGQTAGDRLAPPFVGLARGVGDWEGDEVIVVIALIALVVAALVRAPRSAYTWIALAHVPLALVFNADQWRDWTGFTRPIVPMQAFAIVALAAGSRRRRLEPG